MDVREKLVELVGQVQDCGCDVTDVVQMNYVENTTLVDHLIAHGVTVQEWIPVTERLPEFGERVLCTDGVAVFEQYRVELSCVYGMWDRFGMKAPMQEVTHWMPMPEPPKEG